MYDNICQSYSVTKLSVIVNDGEDTICITELSVLMYDIEGNIRMKQLSVILNDTIKRKCIT